jgi:hypothetical protein
MRPKLAILVLCGSLATGGCVARPRYATTSPVIPTSAPTTQGLDQGEYLQTVQAVCMPPEQWVAQPLKRSSRHTHQIWLSPSGKTAYGVIHFDLPVPVGHELVLWYFMKEMRRVQGDGELLSKQWDSNLRTLRFVASGGRYTIRTNLSVRGFEGWAVYAGTLREGPIEQNELDLAERAREHTVLGQDASAVVAAASASSSTTAPSPRPRTHSGE